MFTRVHRALVATNNPATYGVFVAGSLGLLSLLAAQISQGLGLL